MQGPQDLYLCHILSSVTNGNADPPPPFEKAPRAGPTKRTAGSLKLLKTMPSHTNVGKSNMFFGFGSDLGTLTTPSYRTVLERILGIRVRLYHRSVW